MILLAIDTSGPVAGVAIMRDDELIYEARTINGKTHSLNLMPLIDEAYKHTDIAAQDTDCFAVTVGPGSFTGVRIGVSCVKSLAHVLDKPCIAVDALEALAAGAQPYDGVICPIQDARAGQVYGAIFQGDSLARLTEDTPLAIADYCELIAQTGQSALFVGDGVKPHRQAIAALLGDRAVFAPTHSIHLRPSAVACLAMRDRSKVVDYRSLSPLYLRPPQAERQRNLAEAAKRG